MRTLSTRGAVGVREPSGPIVVEDRERALLQRLVADLFLGMQPPLAQLIQLGRRRGDGFVVFAGFRKRERLEARCWRVARSILKLCALAQRPQLVNRAVQHTEEIIVGAGENDELVIRESLPAHPGEQPEFRERGCCNKPQERSYGVTHGLAGTHVQPPFRARWPPRFTFRFYVLKDILKRCSKRRSRCFRHVGTKVDDPDYAVPPGDIETVRIGSNDGCQTPLVR